MGWQEAVNIPSATLPGVAYAMNITISSSRDYKPPTFCWTEKVCRCFRILVIAKNPGKQ